MQPEEVFNHYPTAVPRYTSYPTAPHFKSDEDQTILDDFMAEAGSTQRLSVYIHIPFCDRLCWFCACHTRQTNRYEPVASYVNSLIKEIELYRHHFDCKPKLGHLHLGGGSPSLLRAQDFERLHIALNDAFAIDFDTEISLEIDPNDHREDLLEGLKLLGVTRVSIGVQDFDPLVQKAINRPQTFEQTAALLSAVRDVGIRSVNIDALYGLPHQTSARLRQTISKVIDLSPDRLAIFGYAHVPWMKKHQTMIKDEYLPSGIERFYQAELAGNLLEEAGYKKVGIDHFARPDDGLYLAAKSGRLHRNFQGYTTDECKVMLPLGASSIGRFSKGYVQNLVPTGRYKLKIGENSLPVAKSYRFSHQDEARGWLIERLMCDFKVELCTLEERFGLMGQKLSQQALSIADSEQLGLCEVVEGQFRIPENARPYARIVASHFDAHLEQRTFRYSRAV